MNILFLLTAERALSLTDQASFDGWLMGKANLCLRRDGAEESVMPYFQTKVLKQTKKSAVLSAENPKLELTVTLVNMQPQPTGPPDNLFKSRLETSNNMDGPAIVEFSVSKKELNVYLRKTADDNMVHKGQSPIVPGLCLLNRFLPAIPWETDELQLEIRFLAPVLTDEAVALFKESGSRYAAFVSGACVSVITIKK